MINKLISKSQVRVLNCENCPSEDYARGYVRAISDVLDLEPIPTFGVDTLEKLKAEIEYIGAIYREMGELDRANTIIEVLEIIDKYKGGE